MKGDIVELPPFADGQTFFARLRRPSLLSLAKSGKIPNSLINVANGLFYGNYKEEKDVDEDEILSKTFELFDILCEACFVEPTYKELRDANIELSDNQLMFVFNYTQQGVKALEPFRK